MYLTKEYTSKELEMFYHKKPAILDYNDLTQIPEIDDRYLYTLAQYAAEMYALSDEDDDVQELFRNKFIEGLTIYKTPSKTKSYTVKNFW